MSENMNEQNQKILELSNKFKVCNTVLLVGMVVLSASALLEIAPLMIVGSVIACIAVLGQTLLRREYRKLIKDNEEQEK